MFDDLVVCYKFIGDLMFYATGGRGGCRRPSDHVSSPCVCVCVCVWCFLGGGRVGTG